MNRERGWYTCCTLTYDRFKSLTNFLVLWKVVHLLIV